MANDPQQNKDLKKRNYVVLFVLLGMVALVFAVTMAKLTENVS